MRNKLFQNSFHARRFFPLGVFATLLLTACVEERMIDAQADSDATLAVAIQSELFQVTTTRVSDAGFCDKDAVGVYVVDYQGEQPGDLLGTGNRADNVTFTYDEPTDRWIPSEPVYFKDKYTPADIYGYYPAGAPVKPTAYPFSVSKDQSREAANGELGGYEASDFLWAKAEKVSPTAQRIPLTFYHRMSGVLVELTEGSGFEAGEWSTLDKQVLISSTTRESEINLATGMVTATGEAAATGIIPYKNGGAFRAVVVPQQVAASQPLFHLTVDDTPYIFRKNTPFTYVSGKLHKFIIGVSKKTDSGLLFEVLSESISAWETDPVSHDATGREYIVVDCPAGGELKNTLAAAGFDYAKVKNLKVTGKIDQRDFEFMKTQMGVLQAVNLKEVEIVAVRVNYTDYPALTIPSSAFSGKTTLIRFVFPDRLVEIGVSAFSGTNLSGSLIIPEGVRIIRSYAFQGCKSLSGTLTLPGTLEVIEYAAFNECGGLIGNLNLPNGVTEIGGSAFQSCSGFTGPLLLPQGLTKIGGYAFFSCSGFTGSLTIPAGIKELEDIMFYGCSGLSGQLHLPKGLISIGKNTFYRCKFRGELTLPEELTIIGPGAFYANQFSGELKLPASLTVLGEEAFSGNQRLTGTIVIPDEIISIAPKTFADCRQLEGIVLPKGIEAIRENAFENCFQLNAITCQAPNPPYLVASAFNGVAKDNFTVEVPEHAVANYQTAVGWNEFRRFAAHRDFSISRNLFRTLNASDSKTVVLRALSGAAWSVESLPEWVTVTPSSGTGKTEVTITVDALTRGSGNREGEVVFSLDGKDYRSRTRVEQYDYTHGDGDVLTLQTATQGAGVDLVFMGDCFDAKDIYEGKYIDGIREAVNHFFAVEPYKAYRDYFNVYVVFGLSPDSGVGTVNTIRESRFGCAYALGGISPDAATTFGYAAKAPLRNPINRTLVTMILNSTEYGGICHMWGDGSAIAVCPMIDDYYPYDYRGVVQHEAGGHGFGKLGDEYIYHNAFISNCKCNCCPHVDEFNIAKSNGWYENLSLTGNMNRVPWSHLIYHPAYSNRVDVYEGGFMHMRGVFRSEPNSCMNNNIPYFSAISRETIVKRIKTYAGESYSFEEFVTNDVADAGAGAQTRAADQWRVPQTLSNKQHAPVFHGDKPKLNR